MISTFCKHNHRADITATGQALLMSQYAKYYINIWQKVYQKAVMEILLCVE